MSTPQWVLVPSRIVTSAWAAITLVILSRFVELLPVHDVVESAARLVASAAIVVLLAQTLRKDPPLPTDRKDQPND